MSYAKKIIDIANAMRDEADALARCEEDRASLLKPEGKRFSIGGISYCVVRKDGTVTPGLEGIQREMLKLLDDAILAKKSKIEGLRWKLVQLGKEGGTA